MAEEYTPIFDENVARRMVVAGNEGNELANEEFTQDIETAPYGYLVNKYGKDVADSRDLYTQERAEVNRIDNRERDLGQVAGDTALAAGSGFVGTVGSVVGLGIGVVGKGVEKVTGDTSVSEYATNYSATAAKLTEAMNNLKSQELLDRQGVSGVEGALDAQDNQAQYERDTAGREPGLMDDLRWLGRGALNNTGRVIAEGAVAGDVIAQGLGSLGPSAKIASAASNLVTKSASFNAAKIANQIAPTQGTRFLAAGADQAQRAAVAAGVGLAEGAGVYTQTVNEILGKTHGELMEGPSEYKDLVNSGVDPDDAKAQIAANAGLGAFGRQFPQAMALGLITGKFEAAPIASFKGAGVIGTARAVGAQTLEEGGQGATGQFNTNIAVRDYVDPNQGLGEGVGQAFAEGAIAGAGMSGVLAVPNAAASAPGAIKDAVTSPAAQKLAGAAVSGVKAAGRGAQAASQSRAAQAVAPVAKAVASKTVVPVGKAVGRKVDDFNSRPDKKIQSETLNTAAAVKQLADAELNTPLTETGAFQETTAENKAAVQSIAQTPTSGAVPSTFSGTVKEGGTVLDNVTGIMTSFAEKGFRIKRMSDSDVLYASQQFNALRDSTQKLPVAMRPNVKKLIASPDFKVVQDRAAKINLNETQSADAEVTDQVVAESTAVAKTNPVNVNPDVVNKILEQDDRTDLTEEDVRVLTEAKNISQALNTRIGDAVEFVKQENVELQRIADQRGDTPNLKPLPTDPVTRDIAVGSDLTAKDGVRSVAQFVGDIFKGSQTADKTFVNADGTSVPVKKIGTEFNQFAQHMINKIGALNASYDGRNANGRGSDQVYTGLVKGKGLVEGAGKRTVYQAGSPGGIRFARTVHADAVMVVEAYNAAVRAFPESFPDGELSVPELRGFETQTEQTLTEETQTPEPVQETVQEPEPTTAVEEAPDAQAPDVTETETPTLEEMMEAETRGKDEFSDLSYDELVESANRWFVDEEGMSFDAMAKAEQADVLDYTDSVLAHFGLPKDLVTGVALLTSPSESHMGQAMWGERLIGMSQSALDTLKGPDDTDAYKLAEHVVFHELMHVIDAYSSTDVTRPSSTSSELFSNDPLDNGLIYDEVIAATEADPKLKADMEYVLSYDNIDEQHKMPVEFFAEIGAMYLRDQEGTRKLFPEGVKYVEKIIEQAGGKIPANADGASTQESEATVVPVSEQTDISERDFSNVNEKFTKAFTPQDEPVGYVDGEGIIQLIGEQEDNAPFVEFVATYADDLMARANKRLATMKTNKSDELTIAERAIAGEDTTEFRRNKNTIMVDPTTGEYDPALLSIAAVAVLDWLSSVRANNPAMLQDQMEELGVSFNQLSQEDINAIMYGVPPRDAAEGLAKTVVRMWGMKINKDTPMVDARGAAETMVKELLQSLTEMTDPKTKQKLINIKMVPFKDKATGAMRTQATFDVKPMQKIQKDMGLKAQGAATKLLAPEFDKMPSIGTKIKDVELYRGEVRNSKMERKALRKMQDTPHKLADGFSSLVSLIGLDALAPYLGRKDNSQLGKDHPLGASIEGKNLSIERDFEEALSVVDGVREASEGEGEFQPVYYKIGISQVGRHQFRGINPQNNKILRAMVTPTHATLDMTNPTHKNNFWLTVGQASGLNKVENENHKKLLSEIRTQFSDTYGSAVALVVEHLNGAELDGAALVEAMGGTGDMAQLSAVFAVAQLEKATADGTLESFDTTLSFELDGKTDGPGNMMANFGQGILDPQDYTNFQRVGFFLGTKAMTLNKFFGGDAKNQDLYEVTAFQAQALFYETKAQASPEERAQYEAIGRFAQVFGDFDTDANGDLMMTRKTAKNPMTKTVYGSSENGVGQGLAQEMSLKMYEMLVGMPAGADPNVHFGYPQFKADFEQVFKTKYPENTNWKLQHMSEKDMKAFTSVTTATLGKILSDTSKAVIGTKITKVNDSLVLLTGFQTQFLTAKFEELLDTMVTKEVAAGNMGKTTAGKPDMSSMTQRMYDGVVEEIKAYSPTYANGMQTLDIGSFTATDSGIRLSSTMDEKLIMNASMVNPELAGVKAIPYITQGRGDAMMMNRIYGSDNAPEGTIPVFDGIDMPIDKIQEYAQSINGAVIQNWDADVLGDIVTDMNNFLEKTKDDGDLLLAAWETAIEAAKKKNTTADVNTPEALISQMMEMHRLNQARKVVFRRIGISVDHMGGSDTAWTRGEDGREYSIGEINNLITQELTGQNVAPTVNVDGSIEGEATDVTPPEAEVLQIEEKREPVEEEFSTLVVTDSTAVMEGLVRETRKKHVQATARVLMKSLDDVRVIIGTPEEVTTWYTENVGQMDRVIADKKGLYDPKAKVMLITQNNHETIAHEMIHAMTFQKLENYYEGFLEGNDQTIQRLEDLMTEFMEIDFSKSNKQVRDAANSARTQILSHQNKTDAFSKAAALNEFMAWTLSNEALMKELKQTPTSIIAKLTKTVKAMMQRLLGGVPADMFSNILFNTELLITGEGEVDVTGGGDGSGNNNTGGNLTPPAHNQTNHWIELAKTRLQAINDSTDGTKAARLDQMTEYHDNAQSALDTLAQGGFNLDAYQRETFTAIHSVLATEMRLDTQSSIALNELFEHVTDNLTPDMFGPTNAQDRFSAVMNLFGETKNDEGVSDAIAVLLALSQTSDGFRRAIDQLPTPPSNGGIETNTLNDFLSTITQRLMTKAVGTIDTSAASVGDTLDKLSTSIILEESDREFRVIAGLMGNITKADNFVKGAFVGLANFAEGKNIAIQAGNRSSIVKAAAGAVTITAGLLDAERSMIAAEGVKKLTHQTTAFDNAVFIRELVSEMIGTDTNNKDLVALLDETTFAVSGARQNYREDLPVLLQDAFQKSPDESQWKATHHVMAKTDFAAVYSDANANSSFRLISDEGFLDKKIAQSEAVIRANFTGNTRDLILEKAQQLADYQNGKGAGFQLWTNALAINRLAGDFKQPMTAEIDKLASYYAIKGSDPQMRIQVTEMYRDDPEAMRNLVVYAQSLNAREENKARSFAAEMGGYKGHIPDHGVLGSKTIIGKDDDRVSLERQGYIRVGDAPADDNMSIISRGYYTTMTKQTGTYSQGIMQIVHDTYRGVDATTGLSLNGTTSGIIADASSLSSINAELNRAQRVNDVKEVLIPRYDEDDNGDLIIVAYERAMNPDIIAKHSAPKSNLALMLGAWRGRQAEEQNAQTYNDQLVQELKRLYDDREPGSDDSFVNLAAEAKKLEDWDAASPATRKRLNMKQPDRAHVESWKVISPATKEMIKEVFGENTFWVRKDQVNLSLGYRDPSVIDMWTGDTRIPKAVQEGVQAIAGLFMGKHAMKALAATEGGIQGLVSTAKDLIVVRSLVVPYMNTQANVFQLQTRGIPIKQMWKQYPNKLAEIEQYNGNVKKLIELETRIQLAGTDKNRVAVLQQQVDAIEGQNKRFTIAPLIEAGAYKNISEGLTDLDVDITSGRIGQWVENQTNKLPGGVQTIAKYGLLSKDTAVYKMANKAVQYGDFIAKAIYYEHLLKEKGLSHDAAMVKVNEEFVNFSVLPGRTRSYLEGIGATWFLSFKIRIMKIAMNQIRENPVRSLITGGFVDDSPIGDNLATVIAEDRLGYSLGWEMLFGSAGLNPWLNISDWR